MTTSYKKEKPIAQALKAEIIENVSFGALAEQKMDVYLPANRNLDTPVIILLHGGGFFAGDKSDFTLQSEQISKKDIAVLNVNYRLVDPSGLFVSPVVHKEGSTKISDQLSDIKDAINMAISQADEWIMSKEKWGITGHSAGGTLALLHAYGAENKDGLIKVSGNWAGATNFALDESEIKLMDSRILELMYRASGADPKNVNKSAYMAISPYWLANAGTAIPTINIRPQYNVVFNMPDITKQEYEAFTNLLASKNVINKCLEIADADHGFSRIGNWDEVINETIDFFQTQFK